MILLYYLRIYACLPVFVQSGRAVSDDPDIVVQLKYTEKQLFDVSEDGRYIAVSATDPLFKRWSDASVTGHFQH